MAPIGRMKDARQLLRDVPIGSRLRFVFTQKKIGLATIQAELWITTYLGILGPDPLADSG